MKQLEARELRVGNYVHYGDYLPQIVEIEAVDGRYESMDSCITSTLGLQYVDAIPLTEEWLEKLGFEKDLTHPMNVWELKPIVLYKEDSLFWCDILGDSLEIKSIHQLQNLYYALTGEELILKE